MLNVGLDCHSDTPQSAHSTKAGRLQNASSRNTAAPGRSRVSVWPTLSPVLLDLMSLGLARHRFRLCLVPGGQPVGRGEFSDFVGGVIGKTGEDIPHVLEWVDG